MYSTTIQIVFLAAASLVVLSSCTRESLPPRAAATETVIGDTVISYRPTQGQIPLNQTFSVVISVERQGHPLPATTPVAVDAHMPAHNHGMPVQPAVRPVEPGQWRADPMLFQMPGHWVLLVTVGAAPATTQARFDIDLRP